MLEEVQAGLLEQATAARDANIVDVASFDELRAAVGAGKWARGPWAGARPESRAVQRHPCLMLHPFADAVWRLASGLRAVQCCPGSRNAALQRRPGECITHQPALLCQLL